jgi:alpha-1,3-rhamnosyltransferase
MSENTIVSVVVISYNSEKYIVDTLNSIAGQTYTNIELIISDDCSTDNTIQLTRDWLKENSNRFIKTIILCSDRNRGIPNNCNKGLKIAMGTWIKFIAADDVLKENAISKFYYYAIKNNLDVLFSNIELIDEYNKKIDFPVNFPRVSPSFFNKEAKEQFIDLLYENSFVPAPASFLNKKYLIEIGGFDESIKLIEDLPLWIRISGMGIKLNLINEILVRYRINSNGLSTQKSKKYIKSYLTIYFKYKLKYLIFLRPAYGLFYLIYFGIKLTLIELSLLFNDLRIKLN